MNERKMKCRDAERFFREADRGLSQYPVRQADLSDSSLRFEGHLEGCDRCRKKYQFFRLERDVLWLAGSTESALPDDRWFAGVRARVNRSSISREQNGQEETWQSAIWLNARQLIPIMALLLLIVLGASLLWSSGSATVRSADRASARPSDRVFFNEVYEYPQPTTDDVLQTLVAVEEKPNGK